MKNPIRLLILFTSIATIVLFFQNCGPSKLSGSSSSQSTDQASALPSSSADPTTPNVTTSPTPPPPNVPKEKLSVEAETFTINTSGGQVSTASACIILQTSPVVNPTTMGACLWGDQDVNMGSYGDFMVNIKTAGEYEFKIFAAGGFAAGQWPKMEVIVDGTLLGMQDVITRNPADFYLFTKILSAGNHQIRISFTNDYYVPNVEDRNLFVDKIELNQK
jgi:hypothetical protein